jgi:PAS domain S-box-containing protein
VELVGTPQVKNGKVIAILGIAHDTTERKRYEETMKENPAQLSKMNRYEKIISAVTRSVHRSINLQDVLENAVSAMSENIDGADSVSIFLVEGEEAVMRSHIGFPDWFVERVRRIPYPRGATWRTIIEGKPRYCPDVERDTVIGPAGKDLGINSYLIMPIHLEGRPVGVLSINSLKKNAFNEEELKLLEIVAQQIEIAINNAKQTEVLREREERFRSVFENGPIGMAIVDLNYRFTKVNKALCEMLGYTEEELTGLTFVDITHPEDVEKDVRLAERVFKGELSNYRLEKRYIKKNQEVLWINLTATAIRDPNGNALYGLAMMENISERKLMEEALREKLVQLSKKNRYETIISAVTRSVHRSINLQDVLENAVSAMSENIEGVDNVSIYMVEGNEAVMKANRGYPDWFLERASRIPYPKGFTWRTIIDGRPRYCPDVDQDTVIGPAGRKLGTKSYASMPINFEGKTVGCISINSLQKNAFNEEELKLLEIVAQQIEVAINNAKQAEALRQSEELLQKANAELELRVKERTHELYEINRNLEKEIAERRRAEDALRESFVQLSKKNRYETIIGTVTRSVHQSIDLQEVFENAVESMSKNIEGVDNVSIYLVEGKEAVMKVHRGLPEWFIKRAGRIPYPKGFTWKTIIEGKPSYCPDVDQDTSIGPAGRELGTKSYLSMPICVEGETIGCINIHSLQKSAFDEEEIRLLEIVAKQIEVAIKNARQAEALRKSEEKYRTLYEDNPSMYFTVDTEGRILSVNRFGLEQLGYTAEEIIGKSVLNIFHKDDKQAVLKQLTGCLKNPGKTYYWEFRKIRKDGSVLWVREAARSVRETDGSTVILIVCEDITERKRAEEQIKESLKEKEVLLKEIQHRVKNNLQVILSLLDLQTEYFTDKKAIDVFKETHNRVRSMALIHEQLYQSKCLAKVDFAEYIRNLGTYLFQSYGVKSGTISLRVEVDDVFLDVDTAITCGLIVNELISNSLKYAFKGKKRGEIGIGLHSDNENAFTLTVKDDGVGFPKHLDFRKTESLGLQLVNALTNQLGGTIRLNRKGGTEFTIVFSNQKY